MSPPNGDFEVAFNLKRPQPALLALLASGYTPVYPCHVSPADMRTKPVGTGPFKFVEFKANEFDQAHAQSGLLEEGPASSRRHRVHHHPQSLDRHSRLRRRQVRHDVSDRGIDPAAQGRQDAGAERGVRGRADQRQHQHHRQLVFAAVRQSRYSPRDGAGARPQGVHLDPVRRPGGYRRHHAARAGRAVGHAEGDAGDHSRLWPRRERQPGGGAQADAEGGLWTGQAPRGQGLDPQYSGLPRPGRDPDRSAQEHLYRRRT